MPWSKKAICLLAGLAFICPGNLLDKASAGTPCSTGAQAGSRRPGCPAELVLPNGLKVLVLEEHAFPVVSTMVWYRAGAAEETPGTTGVSHLVEHLLCRVAANMRAGEIGEAIVSAGGQFNGYTSDDFMAFFETLPPDKIDLALEIEAARMKAAAFSERDVKEEIVNIKKELEEQSKDTVQILRREIRAAAYQQHPYHNPTMGWQTDVEHLTYASARSFYRRYIRPDNATVVLAGDINTHAALACVKKHFAALSRPSARIVRTNVTEPKQLGQRQVCLKSSGQQALLAVAYHAPALGQNDAAALAVIESLLNGAYNGRLRKTLVEQKLCLSAQAKFEAKKDPGLFEICCVASKGASEQKLLATLDSLLAALKDQKVSPSELARARNLAEFSYWSEQDGPYHAAFHLGYFDSLLSGTDARTWPGRLRQVTASDIARAAKHCFDMDNRVIGWAKPTQQAKMPDSVKGKEGQGSAQPERAPQIKQHMTGYKNDDSAPAPAFTEVPLEHHACLSEEKIEDTPVAVAPGLKILSNGLTLIVLESHISPTVEIAGAIKAGGVFDPPGKKGVSAVTAFALGGGSGKHNRAQFVAAQEDSGLPPPAMLQFESGLKSINFHSKCFARDLSKQLSLLGELVSDPAWQDLDINKAKQDVISRLKHQQDDPLCKVNRALWRALVATDSPYRPTDALDCLQSINKLATSDIKDFCRSFINPGASYIVLSGDINLDSAVKIAEQALSGWKGGDSRQFPALQANKRHVLKTSITLRDKMKGKTLVCFGQLVKMEDARNNYAHLLLADCLLTQHPIFSRLGHLVDAEPKMSEALGGNAVESQVDDVGNALKWSLTLSACGNSVPYVISAVKGVLSNFTRAGITQEELSRAKRYMAGALPVCSMSTQTLACRNILQSALAGRQPGFLGQVMTSIKAASVESVNKVIASSFKPGEASMVVAGSKQSITAIRQQASSMIKGK